MNKAAQERSHGLPVDQNLAFSADLLGGLAEWTTTIYEYSNEGSYRAIERLRRMHVLKGHDDSKAMPDLLLSFDGLLLASPDSTSSSIGFRGVRSAKPRFIRP
jgi:hypothetical protein